MVLAKTNRSNGVPAPGRKRLQPKVCGRKAGHHDDEEDSQPCAGGDLPGQIGAAQVHIGGEDVVEKRGAGDAERLTDDADQHGLPAGVKMQEFAEFQDAFFGKG